ncbi:MAG: hypothetical protein A2100_01720 [Sideroxydans sp. GWF2_59_14]|nr:MAG: hypothetical protein A2100_01720 [Sideroxydans sp. GWF2_59_14]HAF44792.1 hypothetical protein [Gallionellaceae bacterium]
MRSIVFLLLLFAIQSCTTRGYESTRFVTALRQDKLVRVEKSGLNANPGLDCDKRIMQGAIEKWSESLRAYHPAIHTSLYRHSEKVFLTFESGKQFVLLLFFSSNRPERIPFLLGPGGDVKSLEGGSQGEVYVGNPIRFENLCVADTGK